MICPDGFCGDIIGEADGPGVGGFGIPAAPPGLFLDSACRTSGDMFAMSGNDAANQMFMSNKSETPSPERTEPGWEHIVTDDAYGRGASPWSFSHRSRPHVYPQAAERI